MNNYQDHPLAGAVDLDSAFNKLWSFYKKYFIGLYLIAVISSLVTSLLSSGIDLAALQSTTDPEEILEIMKVMAGPYTLVMLVSLLFGVLLHAWVLEKPAAGSGFLPHLLKMVAGTVIPYLAAMIILGALTTILFSAGIVLLVLPGLFALFYMITVMLFAMPVTMTETMNPLQVVKRSFRLAHRNLWPNIGWVVVVLLLIVVLAMLLGALTMLPFSVSFIKDLAGVEEYAAAAELAKRPAYFILSALTGALVTPVLPIVAFLLYFRNRDEEQAVEIVAEYEPEVTVEDLYPKRPEQE